jgi:hypothetical protein
VRTKEVVKMYAEIDDKFLIRTRKEAIEEALATDTENKNKLLYPELNDGIEKFDIEEDKIEIGISNSLGFFSFDIPLDANILVQMVTIAIKKMNKVKAFMESIK